MLTIKKKRSVVIDMYNFFNYLITLLIISYLNVYKYYIFYVWTQVNFSYVYNYSIEVYTIKKYK